jgi:hypothetical protein
MKTEPPSRRILSNGPLARPARNIPQILTLSMGLGGEGASKDDRCAISLIHFETDGTPGVSVIDATDRSFADDTLVGSVLTREEVIGTSLAPHIFAIFDAVFLQDQRLDG